MEQMWAPWAVLNKEAQSKENCQDGVDGCADPVTHLDGSQEVKDVQDRQQNYTDEDGDAAAAAVRFAVFWFWNAAHIFFLFDIYYKFYNQ